MKKNDIIRCPWADLSKKDYIDYHDKEWGVPLHDDQMLFEFLSLESAQAGLSWYTILKKRENYRKAFDQFNPEKVARYDQKRVGVLLENSGIVRNRLKIEATINNAQKFLEIQEKFNNFDAYIWRFVDGNPLINEIHTESDYQATSKESETLSKDLKQRGFKFLGATICYAHMQATGMVNDHIVGCFRRQAIIDSYICP